MLEKVINKISEQQKGIENSPAFVVGEHLKEILRANPKFSEIVLQDLDVKEMSIVECEKKIKEYADKHKKGNLSFVPPKVSEDIIKKFYGINTNNVELPKAQIKLLICLILCEVHNA